MTGHLVYTIESVFTVVFGAVPTTAFRFCVLVMVLVPWSTLAVTVCDDPTVVVASGKLTMTATITVLSSIVGDPTRAVLPDK